jgi:hypothetical protein
MIDLNAINAVNRALAWASPPDQVAQHAWLSASGCCVQFDHAETEGVLRAMCAYARQYERDVAAAHAIYRDSGDGFDYDHYQNLQRTRDEISALGFDFASGTLYFVVAREWRTALKRVPTRPLRTEIKRWARHHDHVMLMEVGDDGPTFVDLKAALEASATGNGEKTDE